MSSELMMDSGISGKTKLMILGGVALAFALTLGMLMRPDHKTAAKAEPAVTQTAHAGTMASAPDTMPATPEMPQMTKPAAEPAASDAMHAEPAATVAHTAPDTALPVAVSAPSAATSVGPATEPQDIGAWGEASLDSRDVDTPDPQVAAEVPVSRPRPAVRPPPPPAIDALHPWWRGPARSQGFDVQYVGQAAHEKALVFRFSNNIADPHQAAQHIRVIDDKGEAASGVWAAGHNPYVLVYQGVSPGRYTVSIDAALASASGSALGTARQGPVYVN